MSTKEAASSSPATSSSATKPSSTAATKPHRLPAPTLFVGPPSRTASQLSVSRQGIDSGKDPLTRQRNNKLGRTTTAETSDAKDGSPNTITANNNDSFPPLPTLRKASEKEADARWREMQSTLNEVELTAQSSTHVFGTQHAAALDELRRAQVALAHAWGRGNEEKAVRAAADERAQEASVERFGNADEIARDRREAGGGGRRRGDTGVSVSTTLSDESVLSEGTGGGGGGGGGEAGMGRSQLEDETAQDIKLALERRAANEAYFKKVEEGVKDVVAKLEVVAEAMRGVEGESRSLWGGTASERSSGPAAQSGQRDGFFTRKRATTQRSNRTHKCARAIDQHLDRMRHQRDHIPSQINIMLGLLDALTFWIIALRFSQPVVCDPRYHAYVDIAILVLSSAQMWHTYFGGTDGHKAGVYERFGVSLLMVLALEMWAIDAGFVLG
ncbi:hypothetical protein LTR59_000194 [Friedmanniomyces endolithicus]|nr:hypothetical protein LTR94_001234 [Friedmanniomyces endolithicus]KAK0816565.1 hypothetical protein LTR59_000194 [Friedmanniomyces endolithicus]